MTMNLLCHCERLPDYGTGDDAYFSMNLTVALDSDPEPLDKRVLSPWTWTIGGIEVYRQKGNAVDGRAEATLVGAAADPTSNFAEKLDGVLDTFIGQRRADTFVWQAATEALERDGRELRWHDYLIHASTYPAALTQKGGVTLIFRVRGLGDADRIIAAPYIDFGEGVCVPLEPQQDLADSANALHYVQVGTTDAQEPPFFYEWRYDRHIVAYQRECVLDRASESNDQFLDRESGWITIAGEVDTTAEEWALHLESRLVEVFDLPLRMIEGLRSQSVVVDDTNRAAIVDSVTAAFHDIAGTATQRSAAAGKITHDAVALILHDIGEKRTDDVAERLADYEQNLTLAEWRIQLRTATGTELFDGQRIENHKVLDELLRMHGLLASETTLRSLLFEQWRAALQSDAQLLDSLLRAKDRLLLDVLPRYALRKVFLSDALQEVWSTVSNLPKAAKRADQVAALQASSAEALHRYLHERLLDPGSKQHYLGFHPQDFIGSVEVETATKTVARQYLERFIEKIIPESRTDAGNDALLIQLADVVRTDGDATSAEDQADSSRRISGYGVLLRKEGTSPWSCLNLAHVDAADATRLAESVPVPVRLGFRNGVRQTFIAYENAPLVAQSPFIAPMAGHPLNDQIAPTDTAPPFRYSNPYGAAATQPKLVPLVYGDDYEAAAFAIGTAGSLPKGLARTSDDGNGNVLVEPTVLDLAGARPQGVRKLKFRRRLPVGLPRLIDPVRRQVFPSLPLPEIPRTVLPLARSLDGAEEPTLPPHERGTQLRRPLLFLRTHEPALSKFSFYLQPPSVDIHTWDRWIASRRDDPAVRQARIDVWRGYHEQATQNGPTLAPGAGQVDLSLDDPAVTGWIAQLTRRFPLPRITQTSAFVALEASDGIGRLDVARHKPLAVSIRVNPTLTVAPQLAISTKSCSVEIPDGQVWTLEMFPVVDAADVRQRFAADVEGTSIVDGHHVFEPFALDVETTPKRIVIPAQELLDALQLPDDPDALAIAIDPAKLISTQPWIHRLELVVQQWRWTGRPIVRATQNVDGSTVLVDGFVPRVRPGDSSAVPPGENDDAILFADRSPIDALIVPGFVDFVAQRPDGHALELHRRDLTSTKGALYFRVALRAFSRYEGLIGVDVSADSRKAGTPETWQRRLVPCRWTAPVPAPVVKLIVPLTRPIGDQRTPPLLAILDEPWGDVGGLAENFVAEILSVPRTDLARVEEALPNVSSLPELGPDPLLSVRRNPNAVVQRRAIGPIGYTFDTDTDAPLFVKSSFIVPPPDGIDDLSWYFAKLQFRRSLEGQWMSDGTPRVSDPTPPTWAQYLPPSTRFGDAVTDTLGLRLDVANKRGSFVQGTAIARPEPTKVDPGARAIFELHVILTNRIEDASGRPDQEVFLEIVPLSAEGTFAIDKAVAATRARIVEVQRREAATGRGLWEDLFVQDPKHDAKARIVRVSPPIDLKKER